MLTVEIKINGQIIGHIYAVNEGGVDEDEGSPTDKLDPGGLRKYKWEYFAPFAPDPRLHAFTVNHKRSDGALSLVHKIIHQISDVP